MKKIIIASVCILLLLGLGATYSIIVNKPHTVAARTIDNLFDDILDSSEIDFLTDILNGGSLELDLSSIYNPKTQKEFIENFNVHAKLYTNQNAVMLKDVDVALFNDHIKGELYLSKDEAYIKEELLFQDSLGAKFDELAVNFSNSIFAPTSNSKLKLDKNTYNMIMDILMNIQEVDGLIEDLEKVCKTLMKDISKMIPKHFEFEKTNQELEVNGDSKSVKLITIKVNSKSIVSFVKEFYNYLLETDLITNFLQKYNHLFNKFINISFLKLSIVDLYEKALKTIGKKLSNFYLEIEKNVRPIDIKLYTTKIKASLVKLEVLYDESNLFILDLTNNNNIVSSYQNFVLSYKIEKNTKDVYNAEFTFLNKFINDSIVLDFDVDKTNNKYQITCENTIENDDLDSFKYILCGDYSKNKKSITINFNGIEYYNNINEVDLLLYKFELTGYIKLNKEDSMPNPSSDYKTIDKLKDEDFFIWEEAVKEFEYFY